MMNALSTNSRYYQRKWPFNFANAVLTTAVGIGVSLSAVGAGFIGYVYSISTSFFIFERSGSNKLHYLYCVYERNESGIERTFTIK